jgi:stage V sporulation protein SpoVS
VAWGIVGVLLSLAIGATLIRLTNAELRRLVADAATQDAQRLAVQRRLAIVNGINLLVLLSVFWAMEFKPTL